VKKLKLKKINLHHKIILYKWHNLRSVLKNSLREKKFTMKEHNKWFFKQILSKNIIRMIYIGKIPIGVIRLEKKGLFYLLSYMIAPKYRGKGFAFKAIKQIISNLRIKKIEKVVAIVKKDNIPSLKIFSKLKFRQIIKPKNKKYLKFEYRILNKSPSKNN